MSNKIVTTFVAFIKFTPDFLGGFLLDIIPLVYRMIRNMHKASKGEVGNNIMR
jgi:hypothetical protein